MNYQDRIREILQNLKDCANELESTTNDVASCMDSLQDLLFDMQDSAHEKGE